ncbi:thiamine-phosphate kinase [Thermosynechococcus sp. HN-54]|uniref:thiamine-phosphate kinase n=1 Tax=Thermosynechococcus sp. HN-54 TaxID=2933959 RepID=UPI00202CF91E|nr:thiamine-phosphate kinase [Thermosynechococcus sp. HN-54]URR36836.1 thiamine-phosphate kinase [Thermosynechococcus sp. HN-54]
MLTLADCGELELIARLRPYCHRELIGDDAAVLSLPSGEQLVVSTDVLVEGVHFSLGMTDTPVTMTPVDVGWRSLAANLSDLAAMGALPLGLTVGLAAPRNCPVATIEGIYQGMATCAQAYGTSIIGGDTCRSSVLSLSITVLGSAPRERIIYRDRAKVGDVIVVTGLHGASRAGLECLLHPQWASTVPEELRQAWIQAHQRPQPRLDLVPWLHQHLPPSRIAGMDSSDGLAAAVLQICQASGVGAVLWAEQIPKVSHLDPQQALTWALYGGEDFELVLCVPRELATEVCTAAGNNAAMVGEIVPETTVQLQQAGKTLPLQPQQLFQHF